jgi:hypothetical protein
MCGLDDGGRNGQGVMKRGLIAHYAQVIVFKWAGKTKALCMIAADIASQIEKNKEKTDAG